MKILYVLSDSAVGGAQRLFFDLIRSVHERGHEVKAHIMIKEGGHFKRLLNEMGLIHKMNWKEKFDIYHFDGYVNYTFKQEHNITNYIDTIHSRFSMLQSGFGGVKVAVSNWLLNIIPYEKKYMINNGVDEKFYVPDPNRRCGENRSVVGIGRTAEIKNYERFCNIAVLTKKMDPGINFYIIGDSHNKIEDKEKEKILQSGAVQMLGEVLPERIYSSIPNFWLTLSTSKEEGFGLNLTESMACGLPVISTDNKGCQDIITPGVDGFILEDDQKIAERICYLCNPKNSKQYNLLSNNARTKVMQKFTLNTMVDNYLYLYEEIIREIKC